MQPGEGVLVCLQNEAIRIDHAAFRIDREGSDLVEKEAELEILRATEYNGKWRVVQY